MASRRLFVPFIVAILASCTTPRPATPPQPAPEIAESALHGGVPQPLVTVARDGALWLIRSGGGRVERWPQGATEPSAVVDLPLIAFTLRPAATGGVFVSGNGDSAIIDESGTLRLVGPAMDVAGEERLERRGGSVRFVTPTGQTEVSVADGIISMKGRLLAPGGRAVVRAERGEGGFLYLVTAADRSVRPLAGPFASIGAFDVAPEGTEVVFSARRERGFDIGLVPAEGGEVRWIGPDPLDERMVAWAPRGNKFAYVLETPGGVVVRSVHVPTGFQVSAPRSLTRVLDLAWDPTAERIALFVRSADASERVESMRFDGTERRTDIPPALRGETPDQLAGIPGAVVFAPGSVRYGERLPLVIWEDRWAPFAYNEPRAGLQQNRRIGSVVVAPGTAQGPAFWDAIAELAWVDRGRIYLIANAPVPEGEIPDDFQVTQLTATGDPGGSTGRLTVVRSDSGSLEDFAVRWLGERLRGFELEHDGN